MRPPPIGVALSADPSTLRPTLARETGEQRLPSVSLAVDAARSFTQETGAERQEPFATQQAALRAGVIGIEQLLREVG